MPSHTRPAPRTRLGSFQRAQPTLLIAGLLLLGGCQNPGIRMDPMEEAELERRALDLLIRAAQSEVDVLASNAMEALVNVAPRDGLPYFRAGLSSKSPLIRLAACRALGELRDTASLSAIRRLFQDPSPLARLVAAFAAYRCGDTPQAELLVHTLNDSPDENLRAEAAYLIGRLGDRRALKRLRLATRDKSNVVTVHVYTAMATLGEKDALDQLIRYAQGDAVSRVLAIQSLAELGDFRARDALLYRASPAEDYLQTRLVAARGLGRIGSNAGYALALDATTRSFQDENETARVRSLAALALGAIGDPAALPTLKRLAASSQDARIQVAACYGICQIIGGPGRP